MAATAVAAVVDRVWEVFGVGVIVGVLMVDASIWLVAIGGHGKRGLVWVVVVGAGAADATDAAKAATTAAEGTTVIAREDTVELVVFEGVDADKC